METLESISKRIQKLVKAVPAKNSPQKQKISQLLGDVSFSITQIKSYVADIEWRIITAKQYVEISQNIASESQRTQECLSQARELASSPADLKNPRSMRFSRSLGRRETLAQFFERIVKKRLIRAEEWASTVQTSPDPLSMIYFTVYFSDPRGESVSETRTNMIDVEWHLNNTVRQLKKIKTENDQIESRLEKLTNMENSATSPSKLK